MGILNIFKKKDTYKKFDTEFVLIQYIANNDNIIKQIKKKDKEYNIQIELWDAKIVNVETVNCDSLIQYEAIG